MKKLPIITKILSLALGAVGALGYAWTLSLGTDERGLYPADHIGWLGYCLVSAVTLVALVFLTRAKTPSDPVAADTAFARVMCVFAAALLAVESVSEFGADNSLLDNLLCLFGIVTALALIPWDRIFPKVKSRTALGYALLCAYFVVRLFCMNLRYSGEPELLRFLPEVFAVVCVAIACYRLWGYAVGLDEAKKRHFWQCIGAYFCVAAAPAAPWLAFMGLWLTVAPSERYVPDEPPCEDAPVDAQ